MKRSRKTTPRRSLAIENLEERRVLSASYVASDPTLVVPQDSTGADFRMWQFGAGIDVEIGTPPEHGEVQFDISNLTFTYTPDPGFVGADEFTYVVEGFPFESSEPREVTATVTVVETLFAAPDWARVSNGSDANRIDVLANDYVFSAVSEPVTDPQDTLAILGFGIYGAYQQDEARWRLAEDELSIVEVVAENGRATIDRDGRSISYTPNSDFAGVEQVTYTIEDRYGHRSQGIATIEVSSNPVFEDRFTSEAEFLHHQVDRWLARSASNIHDHVGQFWDRLRFDIGREDLIFSTLAPTSAGNISLDEMVQRGDIVKTDGDFLYVVSNDNGTEYWSTFFTRVDSFAYSPHVEPSSLLTIIDIRDASNPTIVNSIEFDEQTVDLFLTDGRITAITEGYAGRSTLYSFYRQLEHTINVIDVTDPTEPSIAYRSTVQGSYSQARVIGDKLYTIANHSAGLQLSGIDVLVDSETVVTSPAPLVSTLLESGASRFLPSVTVHSGTQTQVVDLVQWSDVDKSVDMDPTGNASRVAITTFDLSGVDGVPIDSEVTDLRHASTIYVSGESIYLVGAERASDDWTTFPFEVTSEIVKYSFASDGSGVEFAAAGEFDGWLLNEFSLGEHEGRLRLATSGQFHSGPVDIHVFEQRGTSLEIVGSLEDIAPGEQVYSARFDGDRGFVVTFWQVDPLFVIDFSDPTQPTIQGHLKIPGFSSYLELVGESHLLGIGRNADETSGVFEEMQISLFDISNPENPTLVDQYSFEGGDTTFSPAFEWAWRLSDHQAVNFIESESILALPIYSQHGWSSATPIFQDGNSAVRLFQIDVTNGIEELGQVEFSDTALRSLHVDQNLIMMSDTTIKVTPVDDPSTVLASLDLPEAGASDVDVLPFASGPDMDMNKDGLISPIDPLVVINKSHTDGFRPMEELLEGVTDPLEIESLQRLDVNGDDIFTPLDALLVINALDRDNVEFSYVMTQDPAESSPVVSAGAQPLATTGLNLSIGDSVDHVVAESVLQNSELTAAGQAVDVISAIQPVTDSVDLMTMRVDEVFADEFAREDDDAVSYFANFDFVA